MSTTTIDFRATNARDIERATQFIAELVRQGIVFRVRTDEISIIITLTGGF